MRNVTRLTLLLLVLVGVGITGCAVVGGGGLSVLASELTPSSDAPPLPEGIAVMAPPPEIPADLAAFAGPWQVRLGHRLNGLTPRDHVLVVERIASPDNVTVVFGIGKIPNIWNLEFHKPRSERVKARFENNKLVVRSGQWIGIYSMGPDGLVADIQHPFLGFSKPYIYHATLRRVNLAEIRKETNAK